MLSQIHAAAELPVLARQGVPLQHSAEVAGFALEVLVWAVAGGL